ncbi:MAG: signal peptide peptidase SppA [Fibrobacteria bacterium]
MKIRFNRLLLPFLLMPPLIRAWDPTLPFSNGLATGTGQAAFGNPAAAAFSAPAQGQMDLGWADWKGLEGGSQRLWEAQNQGRWHAEGLRFYEGNGPYRVRFDVALATEMLGLFSPGLRPAYVWDGVTPDHVLLDAGLDFRPWSRFLAGYWMENLWAGVSEPRIQHLSAAVRPWGARPGALADFNFGFEAVLPESGKRRGYLFAQVPLGFGFRVETQLDARNREGSLGLVMQAGGRWAEAIGAGKGNTQGVNGMGSRLAGNLSRGRSRQAAFQFRTDQKTPFLFSEGNVAELDLNRTVTEGETPDGWLGGGGEWGFADLLKRLDAIEANPYVKSVLVRLGGARCGWAMGEEIHDRLARLRTRGIRVVAYLDQVTPLNYFLASAANVVAMQPQGFFAVNGFAAEVTFYRGLFDKLGVEPQFLRHGKFKSFEEPYTRKEMSPPMRADLEGYLDALWEHYLDVVSQGRGMPKEMMRTALESGEISLSHALKAHLIDTLVYEDQALELAGGKRAVKEKDGPMRNARLSWDAQPRIAVVTVVGDMVLGTSAKAWLAGPDLAGSTTVAAQLREARLDTRVKAVVLRVDSPGGSAQAADIMWREVELLKRAGKPVIASVGHSAASGGYYLICGADRIIAAPNSVVGSIGVLWGKFVLKGLYEKLGLNTETVKTSPHADGNSMARSWDSSEVDVLQEHMDQFYRDFIAKVAAGRKKSDTAIDSLGQGRIFTGTQALGNGLVDELGGLETALDQAATLAGLGPVRGVEVTYYASAGDPTLFSLMGRKWAHAETPQTLAWLKDGTARMAALAEPGLWAISPELAGWSGFAGLGRE